MGTGRNGVDDTFVVAGVESLYYGVSQKVGDVEDGEIAANTNNASHGTK